MERSRYRFGSSIALIALALTVMGNFGIGRASAASLHAGAVSAIHNVIGDNIGSPHELATFDYIHTNVSTANTDNDISSQLFGRHRADISQPASELTTTPTYGGKRTQIQYIRIGTMTRARDNCASTTTN